MRRMGRREGLVAAIVVAALVIARIAHEWVGHDGYGFLAGFITFHLISVPALVSVWRLR